MSSFDPSGPGSAADGIFGLPGTEKEASLVYLPVPWEATVSYGDGTANGPAAILSASIQVDLFDSDVLRPYEAGLFMAPENRGIRKWSLQARDDAKQADALGAKVNEWVHRETSRLLNEGKIPAVVGGDHSVPFGAIQALGEREKFGILHIDAHADTRKAYEGFEWSHASIMHNVLEKVPSVTRLVQVGIRDFCEEELEYNASKGERVKMFFDRDIQARKFEGETWGALCREMVEGLPENVWVSFDVDGLDPRFCPGTGTPVPGGLDFSEANYLLHQLVKSEKKILGFDLCEVSPRDGDEWDGNVGARLLYKLSGWCLASLGKAEVRK